MSFPSFMRVQIPGHTDAIRRIIQNYSIVPLQSGQYLPSFHSLDMPYLLVPDNTGYHSFSLVRAPKPTFHLEGTFDSVWRFTGSDGRLTVVMSPWQTTAFVHTYVCTHIATALLTLHEKPYISNDLLNTANATRTDIKLTACIFS